MPKKYSPHKTPSGKKAVDYGHVKIRLWFPDPSMDPFHDEIDAKAETSGYSPGAETALMMAEHLVAAAAMSSGLGFERTLELLTENAKKIGRIEDTREYPNEAGATPAIGPSGRKFPRYGEVDVYGWLEKDGKGEVVIHTDPHDPPPELLQAAATRFLSAAAWQTPEAAAFQEKGFDAAVDLIAEGAMEAKGRFRRP